MYNIPSDTSSFKCLKHFSNIIANESIAADLNIRKKWIVVQIINRISYIVMQLLIYTPSIKHPFKKAGTSR